MGEKIPYHDGNDGVDLGKIEIRPIILKNTQNDLDLMKLVLKNNIINELNKNMPEIQRIFLDNEILSENENGEILLYLKKLQSEDYSKLIIYKKEVYELFEKQIKNNILFSENEKDKIFEDINTLYSLIEKIEKILNQNN